MPRARPLPPQERERRKNRNPALSEIQKKRADWEQRTLYGITMAERHAMIEAQAGRCGCCKRPFDPTNGRKACTDHTRDEAGNPVVRGILCNKCNQGIGFLGDDLRGVSNAVRYLTECS